MAENEQARQWLDRAAEYLRAQLQWLGAQVVPGSVPHVVIPSHPSAVDWQQPPQHRFEALAKLSAPYDPAFVDRAAHALETTGWAVRVQRSDDPDAVGVVAVVGTRDGYTVQVRTEEGYGGVVLLGETPSVVVYQSEPSTAPLPKVTSDTVSKGAVLCYECDGLGACPVCHGRGWTKGGPSGRRRCRECLGARVCPVCGGAGELSIAELSDEARAQYPDLG
ncbi:hypothetical protein [Nocardia transvalensis]|uniref:hypothetical protein n=1 Tax=Nocardia transvalensis TaxID=37333 RepID=UPI00189456F7|nr:hypothetical protein [Nocardia transvalensis]MBF6327533.1 hypothetical protein [Nocardia transvalensis]